jgi:hypothetical protein
MGTKLYLVLSFLNDLKDSERDVRSLNIIQRVDGWPSSAKNLETVAKLHKLVANDHKPILKMMNNKLQINRKLITQILHEEWGKEKNHVKFVPHSLMY